MAAGKALHSEAVVGLWGVPEMGRRLWTQPRAGASKSSSAVFLSLAAPGPTVLAERKGISFL